MSLHYPIVLRLAMSFLVVTASLLIRGVKPACDVPKLPDVSMVTHSPGGFSVPGLANSFQCRRLCQRTTGCSKVVFNSGAMAGSRNCILILSPPPAPSTTAATATAEGHKAGDDDGMTCQRPCDSMPCGYGETCSRGYISKGPTYLCHSLLRCDTPVLKDGYLKAKPSDTLLDTTVEYSCLAPHVFQGPNPNATCNYTGHWTGLNGKCVLFMRVAGNKTSLIKLHTDEKLTFAESQDWCQSQYRGHLVGFQDDNKWSAVKETLTNYAYEFPTGYILVDGLWETDNYYLWNGQPVLINTAWNQGEPNLDDEHCLVLLKTNGFRVFDAKCENKYNFICEVNTTEV